MSEFPNEFAEGLLSSLNIQHKTVVIMCGPSCSGKSTLSNLVLGKFLDFEILSLDNNMYRNGKFDFENFKRHLISHKSEVAIKMSDGKSIIIDNTHLQDRDVEDVLKLARSHDYHIIVLSPRLDISLPELKAGAIKRKEKTGKDVPEYVIERQYQRFCELRNKYLAEKEDETFGKWLLNYWVKIHNLGNLLIIDRDTAKFFTLDFSDIERFTYGLISFMIKEICEDLKLYITRILRDIRFYLATFKSSSELSKDLLSFNEFFDSNVRKIHEECKLKKLRVNDILMYMLEDMRKLAVEAMAKAYGIDMVLCKPATDNVDKIDIQSLKII